MAGNGWCLVGTQLGAGVFTSNMDPGDAIFIFHELDRARREGIVTGNPLHVLYLVAPVPHPVSPNYLLLPNYASLHTCVDQLGRSSRSGKAVLEKIGLSRSTYVEVNGFI